MAEYRALILALKEALQRGCTRIEAYGDSEIVINAANGRGKKNKNRPPHILALRDELFAVMAEFPHGVEAVWRPREENQEADALSRSQYVRT